MGCVMAVSLGKVRCGECTDTYSLTFKRSRVGEIGKLTMLLVVIRNHIDSRDCSNAKQEKGLDESYG